MGASYGGIQATCLNLVILDSVALDLVTLDLVTLDLIVRQAGRMRTRAKREF